MLTCGMVLIPCGNVSGIVGLPAGGVPHDEEGYVRGEGVDDEPADVGGDVGRQGTGAGDPQAAAALDGEAAVQPHLSEGMYNIYRELYQYKYERGGEHCHQAIIQAILYIYRAIALESGSSTSIY